MPYSIEEPAGFGGVDQGGIGNLMFRILTLDHLQGSSSRTWWVRP